MFDNEKQEKVKNGNLWKKNVPNQIRQMQRTRIKSITNSNETHVFLFDNKTKKYEEAKLSKDNFFVPFFNLFHFVSEKTNSPRSYFQPVTVYFNNKRLVYLYCCGQYYNAASVFNHINKHRKEAEQKQEEEKERENDKEENDDDDYDDEELYIEEKSEGEDEDKKGNYVPYLMLRVDRSELKKMKKRKMKNKPVGLMNLGNTCYLNSLLQALRSTVAFVVNLFLFKGTEEEIEKNGMICNKNEKKQKFAKTITNNTTSEHFLKTMKLFFKELITTEGEYISAEKILNMLPDELNNQCQQDVTEVLRFLFEQLGGTEKEFLRLIFSGVVVQNVECQTCFYVSRKEEIIHDFSFPVPMDSSQRLSIQTYFDTFVQKERIHGNNKYKCSKCNRKRDALKWNEIMSPPSHLILILNRYNWSPSSNERHKINTHVKINAQIVVNEYDYRLYGAIIHGGVSASSGHYYYIGQTSERLCYNKNRYWYKMDDSAVTKVPASLINEISDDSSNDHTPYVLFYRCVQAPPSPSLRF